MSSCLKATFSPALHPLREDAHDVYFFGGLLKGRGIMNKNTLSRTQKRKAGLLDPYKSHAKRLLVSHGLSARQALDAIRAKGYQGSLRLLEIYLRDLRKELAAADSSWKNSCRIRGCSKTAHRNRLCFGHYLKWLSKGARKTVRKATHPNRIVSQAGYSELHVFDRSGRLAAIAKIDNADVERVSRHEWKCSGASLQALCEGKTTSLGAFLLGAAHGMLALHKDGDAFNNRRSNLAPGTCQQRTVNCKPSIRNQSGQVGVSYRENRGKWTASLQLNGKVFRGGSHETFDEAVKARHELEKLHFKNLKF